MATLSVKSIAASCLNLTPTFRLKRNVFGYIHGPIARDLSLRTHLQRISGTSVNLTIFLVGHEPGYAGWFSQQEAQQAQHAVDVMRQLYAQIDLGVRKLYWRYIPTDEATGYWAVDGAEATELTEDFSGPELDSVDVFYVNLITDAGGWSRQDGPCNKNAAGRTGSIIEVNLANGNQFAGILLAHEVGHYLGLPGDSDITNVMGQSTPSGVDSISLQSVNLTNDQGDIMKSHCSIQDPC